MAAFELFDHTADLGVRVRAASRTELIWPAIAGLYACIGSLVARPGARREVLELRGSDAAVLLRDLLAELLHRFERRQELVVGVAAAEFSDAHLAVTVELASLDSGASELLREVKAITYHDLALFRGTGGWEATFIVDI